MKLNPVVDLAEIAQKSKDDYESIVESAESVQNDMIRAEMLKVCNDSKKLHIQTLKELSSICAKEDDQAIKLADHAMRKDELEWKKSRADRDSDKDKEKQIIYSTPVYKKIIGPDGKTKLVKEDSEILLEGETIGKESTD